MNGGNRGKWETAIPWIILGLFILALSGCTEQVLTPKEVDIPISITCKPPVIQEPMWSMDRLQSPVGIFTGTQACLADIPLHIGYERELRAALKACD